MDMNLQVAMSGSARDRYGKSLFASPHTRRRLSKGAGMSRWQMVFTEPLQLFGALLARHA
jgi:hypothetical protein